MKTVHRIIFKNSKDMDEITNESVNFVLTSPPYPMIEIWDSLFSSFNPRIGEALEDGDGMRAYDLMHKELNSVWDEIDRVICPGGIVCINIGDATRKIGDSFKVYANHSRIIYYFEKKGYNILPLIIWKKHSNKPTKFMGSGMLPPNAYVTHEHEYILIFRKNGPRQFKTEKEKEKRRNSAYFWEERNEWFSDIWADLKGTPQKLDDIERKTAAYPLRLAYRLISMYSIQGDTILDPFLGTGTTMIAAMCAARNSIGYEIDTKFKNIIEARIKEIKRLSRELIRERLKKHAKLIKMKNTRYRSKYYGFNVMTKQEQDILFQIIKEIRKDDGNRFEITYKPLKFVNFL
ncbi:MAG: DNA-methyltransferase [Methanothermobacter tenebrarum]|uniref:Type II methyltransferase n=2 Tax=Methanothermobacter tenebrarum TaxID=680118 RepID=A0A328PBS3_9EURY|nr:site-specific DNA-methyltransferase [Methanobacteriaceae archaeon]RAO78561.1 site-specific DNA-methyltransferase [Methanothermobacter tenebrarum]